MARQLDNKVCIVTGAAQGIGRAIVEQYVAEGAKVYAADVKEISYGGNMVVPVVFDVTDVQQVKAAVQAIYKAEKRIDVLVNNAGVVVNSKMGMILRDNMETMFRVNVIAVIELMQLVARLMERCGGGSIVNISSVTAVQGSPGQVAYSATKGAVISLTKSAAKELAVKGIRVNAVAPGIVETERYEELYAVSGEKIEERISKIALGRLAKPDDVAKACVFLASDASSYVSGQVLGVDGCASI